MRRFVSVAISLAVIAAALLVATLCIDVTHRVIRLALPLPQVPIGRAEIISGLIYLLTSSAILFLIAEFVFKTPLMSSARRVASQIYVWGAAWGLGSLYLFLMSSNVFPHDLLIGTLVFAILLFWLTYALFGKPADSGGETGIGPRLKAVVFATFALLKRPWVWVAVLVTCTPLVAAILYVKSSDFRDSVAEFRVRQNVAVQGEWITVPINTKTELLQPIMVRPEPGNPDHLIVLERAGRLYRMGYPDNGTKELLLDFSNQVGEVELENGALGFDFDPQYGENGKELVYIYYTSFHDNTQTNFLSRFDLALSGPQARLATQYDLIALGRPPTQYHNGGHVEFGPDGMLYLAIGEMEIPEGLQNISYSLVSGIMRIDVRKDAINRGSRPIRRQPVNGKTQGYAIPADNPFVDDENALGEFYALGLRNPFRFTFDRETGLIWAGEVGSATWEEVNVIEKGGNYQFPYDEGGRPTQFARPEVIIGEETGPVYTYQHTAYDRSVIGGIVYRGARWTDLAGKYLFGDNYSGKFWAMAAVNQKIGKVDLLGQATKYAQRGFTSMIETPDGRILITVMGSSTAPNGEIVELVPASGGAASSIAGAGAVAAGQVETLDLAVIREAYVTNCARCHGENGYGDGPDAKVFVDAFGVVPTNFHTAAFRQRSRDHVRKVLIEGGGAVGLSDGMPPWKGILTDEEIEAMVDYVMAMPEKAGEAER